ncbi:CPP1-like family protein [Pseudarthrobacter cellobiosi]|uniref:CPP1-like family protein n=1 Tax=Pseudarthrobacter cellobiosi TaxID=2953654 RepID=UPI00208E2888|nr:MULTISPECIES: CPP1-like family protein [unclassified Pseudarthrobacter]MCO4255573.1 CPP1-like family protein [Pseudarthrobacter sp. HLT1-5]MCO4273609.1 CPP1-like family protein [Pseudarthrobacter sp. HLT3-5]
MTGDHTSHAHPLADPHRGTVPGRTFRGSFQGLWHTVVGAVGLVMGILPHVLHHIGLLAGTALVAGSGGTALFGALGLLASVPMLVRLHRRFGSWVAPALGLLVFGAMFSLSAFVIGPAISGTGGDVTPGPVPTLDHTADHTGGH